MRDPAQGPRQLPVYDQPIHRILTLDLLGATAQPLQSDAGISSKDQVLLQ
jgi:hypothetical protein